MDTSFLGRNRLGESTSPYLLQHRENPVHWQPWTDEVLAASRALDRPILLSIGYAACHWCHVMAHESFENEAIASLMNERFVNVKLDREERPDLDAVYQHALALLGEQGGWPLTMFLTPEGEPFWGGTYFPPTRRWGRPGLPDVLTAMSDAWRQERGRVTKNVETLRGELAKLARPQGGDALTEAALDDAARRLTRMIDPFHGGVGDAPKFPNVGILQLLWQGWRRTRQTPMRDAVLLTLDNIAQGGIYDHLGGGFARYSVDARWLVPHFEKMLYDNAQLIETLSLVHLETRSELYRARVEETVAWMQREMHLPGGGFASSLDADSEGVEGKFYVWSEAEIDEVLGAESAGFKRVYDVSGRGNWEHHNILNRLTERALQDAATEARLRVLRARLLERRGGRIRPGLDDKALADWNGLAIAGLTGAAVAFERPDWLALAEEAFAFVEREMTDAATGRLIHAWRDGRAAHPATLEDYANLARAALRLFEATGRQTYLDRAVGWVEILDRHYGDDGRGYFTAADDTGSLIVRAKTAADSAVPAGNGTMVEVLARLHALTGEPRFAAQAEAIVTTFSGELARNVFSHAALLNGTEILLRAVQIVIVGARDDEAAAALAAAARRTASLPTLVFQWIEDGAGLPPGHPAHGKSKVRGRPAAYLCEGPVCSQPITEPGVLAAALLTR